MEYALKLDVGLKLHLLELESSLQMEKKPEWPFLYFRPRLDNLGQLILARRLVPHLIRLV